MNSYKNYARDVNDGLYDDGGLPSPKGEPPLPLGEYVGFGMLIAAASGVAGAFAGAFVGDAVGSAETGGVIGCYTASAIGAGCYFGPRIVSGVRKCIGHVMGKRHE